MTTLLASYNIVEGMYCRSITAYVTLFDNLHIHSFLCSDNTEKVLSLCYYVVIVKSKKVCRYARMGCRFGDSCIFTHPKGIVIANSSVNVRAYTSNST